jgi:hypothetical protein
MIQTIPFLFTVGASSNVSQQSRSVITDKFKVIRIKIAYPSGVQGQIKTYFYSASQSTLSTAKPSGTNLLATPQSPTADPYLIGDDVFLVIDNFTELDSATGQYLVVYAENSDTSNAYQLQAFIEYQDMGE